MFDLSVPEGWRLVKLSDLGEVNRGRSRHRPRDAAHLYGGSYPFVQTGDVKASQGRVTSYMQTYSEDGLAQSRLWPKDTMCITIAANIAETGILQFPACFPDSVIGFIPDKSKCNVYFIEYVFRLLRKHIQAQATGSVQDNINLQTLESLFFPVPELDEQNRIADILCSFDDKIELNRQTNQTLEHIAQAIFKSWFVDFEPTRAKIAAKEEWAKRNMTTKAGGSDNNIKESQAEATFVERAAMAAISGRAIDSTSNSATGALAGLNQLNPEQIQQLKTTAALFPDALVDSELGEIPEGWKVKTLDDVTSIIIDHRGKTPKKLGGDWVEEGHPAVSAKNIKGGRITRHDTIRFLDDEIYSKWMKVEIEKGDILLTSEAPMGEMYFITDETKYCLSQRLYALRADNENVTPSFLYLWLQTSIAQADLEGRATGTTVVGIRQVELRKVNSLVPSLEILKNFEKSILPMFEKLNAGELESQRLTCLRDELLPKLLAGELPIIKSEMDVLYAN